jgi:uncharacterized protein YodC (DUF2158 family)
VGRVPKSKTGGGGKSILVTKKSAGGWRCEKWFRRERERKREEVHYTTITEWSEKEGGSSDGRVM